MFAFTAPVPLSALASRTASAAPLRRVRHVRVGAPRPCRAGAPAMVLSPEDTKPLRITGNNLAITEPLRDHVNAKLGKVVRKFPSVVSKMDVHLTVEHNPSVALRHKAEVVAFAGKTILRTEVRAQDMYAAVDAVEDRMMRTVRKFKERRQTKGKGREAMPAVGQGEEEEQEEVNGLAEEEDVFEDVYADEEEPQVPKVQGVVKRKVFPMPLQTVEDAVLCCEYVDHPWYLFRNEATGQISLVYKRNHGGYGLIEPSNPEAVDDETVSG